MSDLLSDQRCTANAPAVHPKHYKLGMAFRYLLVCVAYYLGSMLGYALIFPSSYISIMWPPNTVLLVAMLLSRKRHWPWLLLMAYPVHLVAQSQFDVTPYMASLYYIFDCGLLLLTSSVLRRAGLDSLALCDLSQAVKFIAATTVSVAIGSLIWSPLIVYLAVGGNVWEQWMLVFLSNLLPFLCVAPGFVIGFGRGAQAFKNASPAQCTEFALLALGLLLCAIGVFGVAPQSLENIPALFYMPLPFLLWAAVRFGPGGLSFAFTIYAAMAMLGSIRGFGPFVTQSAGDSILGLQLFLLAMYVPLLVMASVVAERQGKEDALRISETRYRAVVEDQTERIYRFLPDGTLTFVNGAFCRYFQHSSHDLLGRALWTLLPSDDYQKTRDFLASITCDHPVKSREHDVVAPGEKVRWQHSCVRGFFDEHGRILEYQAVDSDITERKRAEEATKNLAHAGRLALIGELTASIAHEVNQPLAAILSNAEAAELLLDSSPEQLGEVRQILSDIRSDDIRASEVIRRIRTFVQKRATERALLNLNDEITEVLVFLRAESSRRGITVELSLSESIPEMQGDKIQLQQVLVNLLLNSMEAMTDAAGARRLSVKTSMLEDGCVAIAISDSGIGIPPDQMPRLFEHFFSTKRSGMGLGLSIARSIVEAHGGTISAENNAASGATFRIVFPTESRAARERSLNSEGVLLESSS